MVTREDQRAQWMPAVARQLRSVDFRNALAHTFDSKTQTVIIALPDDTMGYVFGLLRGADSPAAVLALPSDEQLELACMWPASTERMALAEEDDAIAQVNDDTSVEMFFLYLREARRPVVVQRLAAQIVSGDALEPA